MLLASSTFDTVLKGYRFFIAENFGSVGQRASKLLTIKLLEWFDTGQTRIRVDWLVWGWGQAADFFLRPTTLTASNFKAL